jgi:hypothetical protein
MHSRKLKSLNKRIREEVKFPVSESAEIGRTGEDSRGHPDSRTSSQASGTVPGSEARGEPLGTSASCPALSEAKADAGPFVVEASKLDAGVRVFLWLGWEDWEFDPRLAQRFSSAQIAKDCIRDFELNKKMEEWDLSVVRSFVEQNPLKKCWLIGSVAKSGNWWWCNDTEVWSAELDRATLHRKEFALATLDLVTSPKIANKLHPRVFCWNEAVSVPPPVCYII